MRALVTCALVATTLFGCRSTATRVRFDHLEHPVSMSPVLRPEGKERPVAYLGAFEREARAYGILYALVDLNPRTYVSVLLEEAIAEQDGNAIVNLELSTDTCAWNYVLVLNLLPFWPSCTVIRLQGDVVRETAS